MNYISENFFCANSVARKRTCEPNWGNADTLCLQRAEYSINMKYLYFIKTLAISGCILGKKSISESLRFI